MDNRLQPFLRELSARSIEEQVAAYFQFFQQPKIFHHSRAVAQEAKRLAQRFQVDQEAAYLAGLLHDIGGVIPVDQRVGLAEALELKIFPADRAVPLLLHQNFSRELAQMQFQITDEAILSAVACHTTLKPAATTMDKVVFLADKIKWDRDDTAPFLADLLVALEESLETACLVYFDWLFAGDLLVSHPNAEAARQELKTEENGWK